MARLKIHVVLLFLSMKLVYCCNSSLTGNPRECYGQLKNTLMFDCEQSSPPVCENSSTLKAYSQNVDIKQKGLCVIIEGCKLNNRTIIYSDNGSIKQECPLKDLLEFNHTTRIFIKDNPIIIHDDIFYKLPYLRGVAITKNGLVNLPKKLFINNKILKYIEISYNELTEVLPELLNNKTNLCDIRLNDNKIKVIPKDFFKSNPFLTRIDLSSNLISQMPNLSGNIRLRSLNMSRNKLQVLTNEQFKNNQQLQTIELSQNELKELPEELFYRNPNLTRLFLNANKLTNIERKLFNNNIKLESIDVSENDLINISEDLFISNENLDYVNISHNSLKQLPENLFAKNKKLSSVDVSYNKLESLTEKLLSNNANLTSVSFAHNALTTIPVNLFANNRILKTVDLSDNINLLLPDRLFANNEKLVNVSFNNLNLTKMPQNIFADCRRLKYLQLQHNYFKTFNGMEYFGREVPYMKLDLSYNHLSTFNIADFLWVTPDSRGRSRSFKDINLSFNNIRTVHSQNIPSFTLVLNLDQNPIECNCHSTSLIKHFRNTSKDNSNRIKILPPNLKCSIMDKSKNVTIKSVDPERFLCAVEMFEEGYKCPEKCFCAFRENDKALVINCTNKNLTEIPVIVLPRYQNYNHTELLLQGNLLTSGPQPNSEIDGIHNVTKLNLSNNRIKTINWIPSNLRELYLDNNLLKRLDDKFLESLKHLTHLTISQNPWICDCKSINLIEFVRRSKIHFSDATKCEGWDVHLGHPYKFTVCYLFWLYILIISLVLSTFLATLIALYYRYDEQIKIWLYARNLCLFWIIEEELDKDKEFDAFISYSWKDEQFLTKHLLPFLEVENSYKICIDQRHFIPGEFISDNIIKSVQSSRRTIVILSNNFLGSNWTKMEFRTAHIQAMQDGRARCIVVLYDDLNEEQLDDILKSYLNSHTYVKWGDPWFWKKLKYAMPHFKPSKKRKKTAANDLELAEMLPQTSSKCT